MSEAALNTCKLLLFGRCVRAVLLSVGVQFLLLTVFLLLINFELFHPLNWIMSSLRLVCSFYTWFACIPLLGAIVFYGMTLSHQHLAERRYWPTRYRWLLHNGPQKLLFLFAHAIVGYLTAWLYTGYLHTDYRHFIFKAYGQDCVNSYHIFLLGMGLCAGAYYFATEYMQEEASIDFDFAEQSRSEKLREVLYATLLKAPMSSVMPTICYTFVFWLFGTFLRYRLSIVLNVDTDDRLLGIVDVITNGRLLFYAWLLGAQIVSNMRLMRCFYAAILSEPLPMTVARHRLSVPSEQELTIVAGLGVFNVYVVQCLAANFLYQEAQRQTSSVRSEIFQLTEPGNRPANWRALCDQCLSILGSFTDELSNSMRKSNVDQPIYSDTSSALLAEKLLLRQYNQLHGIRPVVAPQHAEGPSRDWNTKSTDSIRRVPNWCERTSTKLEELLQEVLHRIPGIVYFFYEPEGAKTEFLLENALPVIWLTQALAQICVASIKEDNYGIVQDDLPAIIKALHRLKCEVDRLANGMPNFRTNSSNFNHLRYAVRRSLYNICISFYKYLGDLTSSGEELRQLQSFVYQG
ncbi:PREDICTED: nucleoporin Ndc1 [Drosophila arizonae]|uniref:Nucleoporin Ndc1 n=1 Tax=Drosophila arizonae TaxID=7263 RepID=A0ABM1P3K7_DROAR|nr:PREDICTED: nucleoporin Ndc1 [Drosophila arizonae]